VARQFLTLRDKAPVRWSIFDFEGSPSLNNSITPVGRARTRTAPQVEAGLTSEARLSCDESAFHTWMAKVSLQTGGYIFLRAIAEEVVKQSENMRRIGASGGSGWMVTPRFEGSVP